MSSTGCGGDVEVEGEGSAVTGLKASLEPATGCCTGGRGALCEVASDVVGTAASDGFGRLNSSMFGTLRRRRFVEDGSAPDAVGSAVELEERI